MKIIGYFHITREYLATLNPTPLQLVPIYCYLKQLKYVDIQILFSIHDTHSLMCVGLLCTNLLINKGSQLFKKNCHTDP